MRLLINAVGLRAGGGLTVGLNSLRAISEARPSYEILALVPANHGYEELCAGLSIPYQSFATGPLYAAWRVWFDQVQVPVVAKRWSADVLFAMNNQAAWLTPCPQLVLFQNPYYIYPVAEWWSRISSFERASVLLQRRLFAATAPRCAYVAAQTTVAAERLQVQYGIDAARLAIVPSAVAPEHFGVDTEGGRLLATRMREATAGRTGVLTLARYYPHKDLEFIVRVARRLRDLGDRQFVFFITIAADQHAGARALLETIDRDQLSGDIVNVGPIRHDELRVAYQASRVCFVPTFLESMSGSYIEALQYQLPIVTTDRDYARESCGPAAEYFPPGDVDLAIHRLRAAAAAPAPGQPGGLPPKLRLWVDVGRELAALIDSIPRRTRPGSMIAVAGDGVVVPRQSEGTP